MSNALIQRALAFLDDFPPKMNRIVVRPDRPVVSFTFDDAPRSAYTLGREILERHGARGTYYIAMGLVSRKQYQLGKVLLPEDVRELVSAGHEIGCHSYSHLAFGSHSEVRIALDLWRSRRAIESVCGHIPRQFAFPFGEVNPAGLRLVTRSYESSRGIFGGINLGDVPPHLLLANRLYEQVSLEANLDLVRANGQKRGWLIFYTHDVSATPSEFGCTPAYLERVVAAARDSGALVLPVGEVIRACGTVHRRNATGTFR
jgi:peptidoglycan/xylan/chitin deacetylase (PgdA/CDA1 family)